MAAPSLNPNNPPKPSKSIQVKDARAQLQDCDIILCRGHFLISRIFESLTHGRYSHAAIAAHWDEKAMLCQAEAVGVQAVPLWRTAKDYNGQCFWYRLKPEFLAKLDIDKTLKMARTDLGLKYGYLTIIKEMLFRYFGFPRPMNPKKPTEFFCSQYVSACFRNGGIDFSPKRDIDVLPGDISGSDMVEFLGVIEYTEGAEIPERMPLREVPDPDDPDLRR
jgi:hypothetical protein